MSEENGSLRFTSDGKTLAEFTYEGVKFYEPPKYAGGYRFGGHIRVQFNVTTKPCWFHRKMVKLVLGWEWVDL